MHRVIEHSLEIRMVCQTGLRLPKPLLILQWFPVARRLLWVGRLLGLVASVPANGCGRVPGVIEIGWHVRSVSAFLGYRPPKRLGGAQRFVFDPVQQILIVGEVRREQVAPGSPHEQLAQVIGAFEIEDGEMSYPKAVGGMLSRAANDGFETNEKSPNLDHNWTPEVREQFLQFVRDVTGRGHRHRSGS